MIERSTDRYFIFGMPDRKNENLKRRQYSSRKVQEYPWAKLRDQQLLNWRLCDLRLDIAGSPLEAPLQRLYQEIAAREIRLRPHCWLSDDWFSPDGIPGIAVPFYMAHPRLIRLERSQMLEVEGGTRDWCMKILRHEAGHAIDTAFRLHRRKKYREIFGRYSAPYPDYYRPKPNSKAYVIHLEPNYAQSHPSEDFAETFAVWLNPRNNWRKDYQGWAALRKLAYVDELMSEIAGQPAKLRSRKKVDPLRRFKITLREHYHQRHERYEIDCPQTFENELRRLFVSSPKSKHAEPAADFLQKNRVDFCRAVAQGTGEFRYNINRVLGEMIKHCRKLDLYMDGSESETKHNTLVLLTVHTVNYLHGGHHRVAL